MKSCDIIGEIWWDEYENATVLCANCAQRLNGELGLSNSPIFANDEWDYYPTCDKCNETIAVVLVD